MPSQLNANGSAAASSHFLQPGTKAKLMSEAYHRYALNYINALNYLETLRRHQDFCDFEKVSQKPGNNVTFHYQYYFTLLNLKTDD